MRALLIALCVNTNNDGSPANNICTGQRQERKQRNQNKKRARQKNMREAARATVHTTLTITAPCSQANTHTRLGDWMAALRTTSCRK